MRIGLLYPERRPLDPQSWSGTPAGLASGFRELGCEVVPIGAHLPYGGHELFSLLARATGRRGAIYDRTWARQYARNLALHRELKKAVPLDLVIAMGSEMYDLSLLRRHGVPIATYDDGTLAQMWRHPDSDLRLSGFPEPRVKSWISRQLKSSRAADLNLVSTSWAARSFASDYGIEPAKVSVVGMGHRPRTVDAQNRDWTLPRYLFIGVDWRRKNGDAVLAGFRRVRDKHPHARLDLVGNIPAIDEAGVVVHGLLKRGDAAGQRKIDGLLGRATCFAMPSRFDPSPIAYLEAGSAGLPVVATVEGGAVELLGEGATAVDPRDVDAVSAAMLALVNPSRAEQQGQAARRAAAATTWQGVAEKMLHAATALRPGVGPALQSRGQ